MNKFTRDEYRAVLCALLLEGSELRAGRISLIGHQIAYGLGFAVLLGTGFIEGIGGKKLYRVSLKGRALVESK